MNYPNVTCETACWRCAGRGLLRQALSAALVAALDISLRSVNVNPALGRLRACRWRSLLDAPMARVTNCRRVECVADAVVSKFQCGDIYLSEKTREHRVAMRWALTAAGPSLAAQRPPQPRTRLGE